MKLGLQLMLFMESIFAFSGGLFGPLYAIFLTGMGGNVLNVGIASAIFFATSSVVTYFMSRWKEHHKSKETLYIIGYFISAWAFLFYMLVGDVFQLYILQALQGIGLALSVPTKKAIYLEHNQKSPTKRWTYLETLSHAAFAVASLTGSYVAYVQGFKTLFIFVFMLLIFGVGIYSFLYIQHEKRLNKDIPLIKAEIKKPLLSGKKRKRR